MLFNASLLTGIPNLVVPSAQTDVSGWVWAFFPSDQLIREDMTFLGRVINQNGAPLNAQQVKRLLKAESRRFQPRGVAGCYIPHNAFVFYDAEKKPVAFLEICFDCLGARVIPEDPGFDPDYFALAVLCTELKLPLGFHNKTAKMVRNRLQWSIDPSKVPRSRKQRPTPSMPDIPGLQREPGVPKSPRDAKE